jgi:succinate dehydrogenase/fumarate reductase-like Fe-S protein
MAKYSLKINGKTQQIDVDPSTPILWVLRDHLKMTGTKFGCGMAMCGACTIHLDGNATRSCVLPVSAIGKSLLLQLKAYLKLVSILFNKHGSNTMLLSAVSVKVDKLCRHQLY